jgi:signal transduction histidine kinase
MDNAVKHGKARSIVIRIGAGEGENTLSIEDDGKGFFLDGRDHNGLGLRTMEHRAHVIRGALEITRGPKGGTLVTCSFPEETDPGNETRI